MLGWGVRPSEPDQQLFRSNFAGSAPLTVHFFENVELHDCTFKAGCFRGVKIVGAEREGMTIDGKPVTEMIDAYEKQRRAR